MALKQLLQIPSVNAYVFDTDFDEVANRVVIRYALPPERLDELLDLVDAVIDGSIHSNEMPSFIEQAFGIAPDKAEAAAKDLAGNLLLPLTNYLPDIEQTISDWGGQLKDYPTLRIAVDEKAKFRALDEITKSLKISFNPVLFKRFVFLLEQYAVGDKTEASLKTFFTRSQNIGGLGLTEDQATALLAASLPQAASLLEQSKSAPAPKPAEALTQVVVESPTVKVVPETAPKQELEVVPTHALVAEVPIVNQPKLKAAAPKAEGDHSELKLPAKKAALARKLTASSQDVFTSAITLATNQASAVLKKNKISDKVFADLADKAIRGVRDIYQTRDLAERDWHLKGQDLATLMVAITAGVDMYQSAPQVKLKDKSEKHALSEGEGIKVSEDKQLDARFAQITKGSVDTVIEPARTQLTVGSAVPKTPAGQRKMVDVMSTHRLAGPIEQLGKLSTTEFRRLSSSAAEAAQKIEDLLLALETTAYSERVKGVLAWRNSPMNQLYLHITEEALSQNLALPEVSSRRRAAGKDSLSPAEIKALALLNAKIRF